ncbi:MAG: Ig-like domain-containing protein [Myxococcota bacterium]
MRVSSLHLVLSLALLGACGKEGTEPSTPPGATPPAGALGGLTVVAMGPTGEVTGPLQVFVTFDKPVAKLGALKDEDARAFLRVEPSVPGKHRFLGTQTVVFEPTGKVPRSTAFTATSPAGARAVDGTSLKEDHKVQFTTQRLVLVHSRPPEGFSQAESTPTFVLTFNQPISPADVTAAARFVSVDGGTTVPAECAAVPGDEEKTQASCKPRSVLPTATKMKLVADASLHGAEGLLGMEKPLEISFQVHGPLDVLGVECPEGCRPEMGARLKFTTPVVPKSAADYIEFTPAIGAKLEGTYAQSTFYLHGLKPSTTYGVKVKAGMPDAFGQRLAAEKSFSFTTAPTTPAASFPRGFLTLEPGRTFIAGTSVNAKEVEVSLWAVADQEASWFAHVLGEGRSDLSVRTADSKQTVPLAGPMNEQLTTKIDLAKVLTTGRGLAAYELRFPHVMAWEDHPRRVEGFVQITPLGVTVKASQQNTLVWVTELSSSKPVGATNVTLYNADKRVLWQGTTDESGLASAPGTTALNARHDEAIYAIARRGDDVALGSSAFTDGISPWELGVEQSWAGPRGEVAGLLFTDRGVYRPGETMHVKAIARMLIAGELSVPTTRNATLVVTGPTGDDVLTRKIKLTALGTTAVSIPIDAGSRLGTYTLRLSLDDQGDLSLYTNVQVEQFKAPDFKVEVTTSKSEAIKGETVSAVARTLYLFGAPLADARSTWTVSRQPTSFSPPGVEGFTFFDDTRWLDQESMDSATLANGQAQTAADGSITLQAVMGAEVMKGPDNAVFEVTTVDPSGQAVTGRATVLVHPGEFYLGLRSQRSMVQAGSPIDVEAVALKPDGTPASTTARGVLFRREYKAVKQQGVGDAMETLQTHEDVEVTSCELKDLGKDPRKCSLTPPSAGLYILSVVGKDTRGNPLRSSTVLWVYGPGEAPWSVDDTLAVKLVADKSSYKPGEVARVLIQNPFPKAHALVTVERGGVAVRQVMELTGSAPTVEIPIEEKHIPNVYVGVVVVRGRLGPIPEPGQKDDDRPAVRAGYVRLDVDRAPRRVTVDVTPDAAEHGPRDTVKVRVALKDHTGAPLPGEVTLLAVDEAVLQLTGFHTPDPLAALYSPRALGVRMGDTRVHLVGLRGLDEKGESEGGGGLGALLGDEAVRGRFQTTAYFNPAITVPASGSTEVSFELPDNLTAFRLMAVAVVDGNRFGHGQAEVRVKKPLMLRAAASRLLRVGDQADLGVVVVNNSGQDGGVDLHVENKTPEVWKVEPVSSPLAVKAGASVPVRVKVSALKVGTGTLQFTSRMGTHTDGLRITLPVSVVNPMVHDATYGTVAGGTKVEVPIGIPDDVLPDFGGLTVALSSSVLTELAGPAVQLRTYPYECLEQTASRTLPLVELAAVRASFDPSLASDDTHRAAVQAAVQRILRFQNDDGGYAFWPGMRSSAWLTAYAVLVLDRIQKAGHAVPGPAIKRGVAWLRDNLRRPNHGLSDDNLAFVLDVLSTMGESVASDLTRLHEKKATLSLDARAWLAHAAGVGRAAPALKTTLTEDLLAHVHQSPKGATVQAAKFEALWGSPTRTQGLVLRALVALQPQHVLVEKVAQGLIAQQVKGRYRTTQEAAWALMALHDYQAARESGELDIHAVATVGENAVTQAQFNQRSTAVMVGTLPLADARQAPLVVRADGKGEIRYGATISYAPSRMPAEPTDRGMYLERRLSSTTGQALTQTAPHGALLQLTVEVATPMDRNQVVVDVPVPAGLELVNARFVTSETVPPVKPEQAGPDEHEYEGAEGEYAPFPAADPLLQGHFDHVELRDDRLLLFATRLPRGVHRYVVGVRTVTPGAYAFPPARSEEMYTPEVFGMTPGATFTVEAQKPEK